MPASPFSLENKIAIVTGGGVGIGRSIAVEFARAGADVVVASRKLENLEPVTAEIKTLGRRSFAMAVDVRQEDAVKELVERTVRDLGRLDIMVNNAGRVVSRQSRRHHRQWLEHRGPDQPERRLLRLQVGGAPDDGPGRRRHHQRVVDRRDERLGDDAALRAAKAAVVNYTRSLGMAWGRKNVRVNCIAPGPIETEGYMGVLTKQDPAVAKKATTRWRAAWAWAAGARWRRSRTRASSSPRMPRPS
jgi:3-oxoacyl-[acyl-carrier protein] reductase